MDGMNFLKVYVGPSASNYSTTGVKVNLTVNVNFNRVDKEKAQNSNFGIPWDDVLHENPSTFTYLSWHSRVTKDIKGRDQERAALHDWVKIKKNVSAKFITGDGGVGKSRLAAQFAEELLQEGWNAGFLSYSNLETGIALPEAGTLIVIDYPEENLTAVESFLKYISEYEYDGRIRILLLSRKPEDDWIHHIVQWHIERMFDMKQLRLDTLGPRDAYQLYIDALFIYAGILDTDPKRFNADDMDQWLTRRDENKRPLYILALALYSAYNPNEKPVNLNSSDIINALVERERSHLETESKTIWGNPHSGTLEIIATLATLAGDISTDTLLEIKDNEPVASLFPNGIELKREILSSDIIRGNSIPALKPDIMAAALVAKVLMQYEKYASELLWYGISPNLQGALDRFSRLCHDAHIAFGRDIISIEACLYEAVFNRIDRCEVIHDMFTEPPIPQSCLKIAVHACSILADNAMTDSVKARYINNLSNNLHDLGDINGALEVIQEAVKVHRRLVKDNPTQYKPDLAVSLNNLSVLLTAVGDSDGALKAIQEAVRIRSSLVKDDPARYNPDLAHSLNNLSNRLFKIGDSDGALKAIQEAVRIFSSLVEDNPARYKPDLAVSLNNLSNRLFKIGDSDGALKAIQNVVRIFSSLVEDNPARYKPDLAVSLNNLSILLYQVGNNDEALEVIQEAVNIRSSLVKDNPTRFKPDLANSLGMQGFILLNKQEINKAIKVFTESIEHIRPFAEEFPGSPYERLLHDLERALEDTVESGDEKK